MSLLGTKGLHETPQWFTTQYRTEQFFFKKGGKSSGRTLGSQIRII